MLKFNVFADVVMHPGGLFSERGKFDLPTFISRDAHGHLHCDDGPAVEFSNGRKLYFRHGTEVREPDLV